MNPTSQLSQFYDNEPQRDAVKVFMIEVLKMIAVERAFEGEPVTGIQEARELVDKTFNKLEELYRKVEKPVSLSSR